jgi:hypothetical protein
MKVSIDTLPTCGSKFGPNLNDDRLRGEYLRGRLVEGLVGLVAVFAAGDDSLPSVCAIPGCNGGSENESHAGPSFLPDPGAYLSKRGVESHNGEGCTLGPLFCRIQVRTCPSWGSEHGAPPKNSVFTKRRGDGSTANNNIEPERQLEHEAPAAPAPARPRKALVTHGKPAALPAFCFQFPLPTY